MLCLEGIVVRKWKTDGMIKTVYIQESKKLAFSSPSFNYTSEASCLHVCYRPYVGQVKQKIKKKIKKKNEDVKQRLVALLSNLECLLFEKFYFLAYTSLL